MKNEPSVAEGGATMLVSFVKVLHSKGLCNYDYGDTEEMLHSGYKCDCWEYAAALVFTLKPDENLNAETPKPQEVRRFAKHVNWLVEQALVPSKKAALEMLIEHREREIKEAQERTARVVRERQADLLALREVERKLGK
jgi:hypothetical protein